MFKSDQILENRDEPFYIRIQAAEEILERGKFKPKKPEEMMGQVDIVSDLQN